MMMVDPAYQRMGAGRLLVKWGLAEADRMGVDVSQPHSVLNLLS
jgi:predicted N-acetyltransferase YhbS